MALTVFGLSFKVLSAMGDAQIAASQERIEEQNRDILRELRELKRANQQKLDQRFDLGYALVLADGKRYSFDDSGNLPFRIDWSTFQFRGSSGGRLVFQGPTITHKSNPNLRIANNFISVSPEIGSAFSLWHSTDLEIRFEILSHTDTTVGAVFGASSHPQSLR